MNPSQRNSAAPPRRHRRCSRQKCSLHCLPTDDRFHNSRRNTNRMTFIPGTTYSGICSRTSSPFKKTNSSSRSSSAGLALGWRAKTLQSSDGYCLTSTVRSLWIRKTTTACFRAYKGDARRPQYKRAFDAFYHNQILYELANQWISKPGVFTYDFDWLAPSRAEEVREFVRKQFTNVYGLDPEDVHVLEEGSNHADGAS